MKFNKVLLWLHWKKRHRHYAHSLWEVLIGTLAFVVVFLLKHILVEDGRSFVKRIFHIDVAFVPHNNITRELMDEVCLKQFNENVVTMNCVGFHDENQAKMFLKSSKFPATHSIVMLNFHNIHGHELPDKISYSLQYIDVPLNFHNSSRIGHMLNALRDDDFRPKNRTLLAHLQLAIDKAIIQKTIGHPIDLKVAFHDMSPEKLKEASIIHAFLVVCCVLAPLPFFMHSCSALVEDDRSGINELLRLAGVSYGEVRLAYLIDSTVFGTIYAVIITVLIKITDDPILPKTNGFIIGWTYVMYFLSIQSLTFICSSASHNYQYSDSLSLLLYLSTFLINIYLFMDEVEDVMTEFLVYSFIPHAPLFLFWDEVIYREQRGDGVTFDNILLFHDKAHLPVSLIWVLFVMQFFYVLLIAWYLYKVKPGTYGIATEWNFIFKKKFWWKKKKKKIRVNFHETAETEVQKDPRFFERHPEGIPTAIRIAKLTKVFRTFGERDRIAVDNLNLDVLKGQITVLLGTNGAGKSTVLSIIAGMFSATSGMVYVLGMDLSQRYDDLKKDLGYCSERNLMYDYLTVKENVSFFERLRGKDKKNDYNDAENLIDSLKLTRVKDLFIHKLSHGQKRCLQIACALVGEASVLVLDEPTSGMDSDLRHALWDILLMLRNERTILMTTTDMAEADALGDRIALIHNGKLKCIGSPSFLKQAIGTDFKITIKMKDLKNVPEVESIFYQVFREQSSLLSMTQIGQKKLYIGIPASQLEAFPTVFDTLEAKKNDLGIVSMHIGISMEQVLVRFTGEDENLESYADEEDELRYEMLKGWPLRKQQFKCLFLRVFAFIKVVKLQFFLLQFFVPLCALIAVTVASNSTRKVSMKASMKPTMALHSMNGPVTILFKPAIKVFKKITQEVFMNAFSNVHLRVATNPRQDILNLIENDPKASVAAFQIDGNQTDIYYPNHMTSAVINAFSNMYLSQLSGATLRSIDTDLGPLSDTNIVPSKYLYLCLFWAMWVAFLVVLPLAPLILICIYDYQLGIRYTHQMAGCPCYVIWMAVFFAHMVIYTAIVPVIVVGTAASLDENKTFDNILFLEALCIMLLAFGPAFLLHWYVLSFFMSTKSSLSKIYTVSLFLGLLTPIFMILLSEIAIIKSYSLKLTLWGLYVAGNLVPAFTFSLGIYTLAALAHYNAFCRLNYHLCPDNMVNEQIMTKELCCGSNGHPFPYYRFPPESSALHELLILLVQSIVYSIVLWLLQQRILQNMYNWLLNLTHKPPKKIYHGHATMRAKLENYVVHTKLKQFKKLSVAERQKYEVLLIGDNLYTSTAGLKGITFRVRRGQCLVVMGKTGSGKTSLLRLIAGWSTARRGECYANGYFLKKNRVKYIQDISMASSSTLDGWSTGYEALRLLAMLCGYKQNDAPNLAHRYLNYMGLTPYKNMRLKRYSPGCAHRFGVCIVLVQNKRVALLDEPCVNIDLHMKPLITRAIHKLRRMGTACVVTDDSMNWNDLCEFANHLAILDRGEIVALGSLSQIKHELGAGYTVKIKLNIDAAYRSIADSLETESSQKLKPEDSLWRLKLEFGSSFPGAVLMDEHMSLLDFHIGAAGEVKFSEMFKKLEEIKQKYNDIIEDYTLSETSIGEIICRLHQRLHGTPLEQQISAAALKISQNVLP